MLVVALHPGFERHRTAVLRTLTGADELAAEEGAIALLDRLLVARDPHSLPPGSAARLPVSDRDRLLACLHRDLFGDGIEADACCSECGTAFAIDFTLSGLIDRHRAERPEGVDGPDERGHFTLDRVRFRLPSSADVAEAVVLEPEDRRRALLSACVVDGDAVEHEAEIEGAIAAIGPMLDIDLDATCPHCGAATTPHFEIGDFFLRCLFDQRRFLLREVHRIARAYGWALSEIIGLPRPTRQDFVRLIDGESVDRRRPAAVVGWAS
jgi:hypothetical protein